MITPRQVCSLTDTEEKWILEELKRTNDVLYQGYNGDEMDLQFSSVGQRAYVFGTLLKKLKRDLSKAGWSVLNEEEKELSIVLTIDERNKPVLIPEEAEDPLAAAATDNDELVEYVLEEEEEEDLAEGLEKLDEIPIDLREPAQAESIRAIQKMKMRGDHNFDEIAEELLEDPEEKDEEKLAQEMHAAMESKAFPKTPLTEKLKAQDEEDLEGMTLEGEPGEEYEVDSIFLVDDDEEEQ